MTCKSPFRIHSATQRSRQSQWRNLPPKLRPRSVLFKCIRASLGTVASGLPSKANNVRDGFPKNEFVGSSVRRLNPMSKTCEFLKLIFIKICNFVLVVDLASNIL